MYMVFRAIVYFNINGQIQTIQIGWNDNFLPMLPSPTLSYKTKWAFYKVVVWKDRKKVVLLQRHSYLVLYLP